MRSRLPLAVVLAVALAAGCSGSETEAIDCTVSGPDRPPVHVAVTDGQVRVTADGADPVDVANVSHDSARRGVVISAPVEQQPTLVVLGPVAMSSAALDGTVTADARQCGNTDIAVATAAVALGTTIDVEGRDASRAPLFNQSIAIDSDRTNVVAPIGSGR